MDAGAERPCHDLGRDAALAPGLAFYDKLQNLLAEAAFDASSRSLQACHTPRMRRRQLPPGIYLRIRVVGYFGYLESGSIPRAGAFC